MAEWAVRLHLLLLATACSSDSSQPARRFLPRIERGCNSIRPARLSNGLRGVSNEAPTRHSRSEKRPRSPIISEVPSEAHEYRPKRHWPEIFCPGKHQSDNRSTKIE